MTFYVFVATDKNKTTQNLAENRLKVLQNSFNSDSKAVVKTNVLDQKPAKIASPDKKLRKIQSASRIFLLLCFFKIV